MYRDPFSTKSDRIEIDEKDCFSGFFSDAAIPLATTSAFPIELLDIRISQPLEPLVVERESNQSWYWTRAWQQMEKKADEDMRTGNYQTFDSMDDFLAALDT